MLYNGGEGTQNARDKLFPLKMMRARHLENDVTESIFSIVTSMLHVKLSNLSHFVFVLSYLRIETREKRERHRSTRWRQFKAELKHMKKNETLGGSIWFSGVVEA